jgi:FemAB-related protein (PEP-CTERM system-associated)
VIEIGPSQIIQVKAYVEADAEAWQKYVCAHPSATVFHMMAWSRAVERTYGHRPMHLTAWSDDRLVGALPLFLVKSIFVGRVLVSVPYATYGGILADSDEVTNSLLEAAEDLSAKSNAEYLELRHRDENNLNLPEIDRYDTFRKRLPENPDDVLPSLPKKTRAAARKGLKVLTVGIGADLLDPVYDLYSYTMRRLGSPNFKRRLFHELQNGYGEDCVCLVVKDDGKPVAGVISYVFRDEIVPYFSGSLPDGTRKNANNVMYLKLMEYAIERGLRWFDFNRTRRDNRGPHAFKRYHGFEPSPLHYQISLNKAKELPNLSPSNRKFALAGRLWRKLPLCLTRSAGGRITKWIP